MAFDSAGFAKAARAMGYSDNEIAAVSGMAGNSAPSVADQQDQINLSTSTLRLKQLQDEEKKNKVPNPGAYMAPKTTRPPLNSFAKTTPSAPQAAAQPMAPQVQKPQVDPEAQVRSGGFLEQAANFLAPNLTSRFKKVSADIAKAKTITNPAERAKFAAQAMQESKPGAKDYLEGASFVTPTGGGLPSIIAKGMLSGGLRGASEGEDYSTSKIMQGSVGGAVGGAVAHGAGKALSYLGKKVAQSATEAIGKQTPAMWQKALEEHGVDLNGLVKKYWPKGGDYDEVLGGTADRGRGGVLKKIMDDNEKVIQDTAAAAGRNIRISGDDLIGVLRGEAKNISHELGGETRSNAISNVIKQAEKKYAKGMSVKQAIDTLRYANEKFGKNIVDVDAGDAVVNAAQKLEANTLRTALKAMFPALKDALDTQSEILTLRPVLNRARAVMNTQGSTIRTGKLSNVHLNPLSWGAIPEAVFQNPKTASKWMNAGQMDSVLPDIVTAGGRILGGAIGSKVSPNPQQEDTSQTNNSPNGGPNNEGAYNPNSQINHISAVSAPAGITPGQGVNGNQAQNPHNLNTIPPGTGSQVLPEIGAQQYITGYSPEELSDAQMKAYMNGDVTSAEYFGKMYEREAKYQDNNKAPGGKKTEKQQMFVNASQAGQKALDLLQTGQVSSGIGQNFTGAAGEKFGTNSNTQQEYRSTVAIARTIARNAMLGANMSTKELESIAAFIPEYDDAPNIAKIKLQTFVQLMNQFGSNLQGTATPSATLPDITVGQ